MSYDADVFETGVMKRHVSRDCVQPVRAGRQGAGGDPLYSCNDRAPSSARVVKLDGDGDRGRCALGL